MTLDTIGSGTGWRLRHSHLRMATEALAAAERGLQPADAILRELFAKHRNAGARDRAQISALVYGVLRDWYALAHALGSGATPLARCVAFALGAGAALPPIAELDVGAIAQRLAALDRDALDEAARRNLPPALWQRLVAQYGAEAAELAAALNTPGTVDLRVNTLKATRAAALAALAEDGITATPIEGLASGLRLSRREPLQRLRAFRDGWVEPQDAGSQRLADFVAPRAGERIADFCAGAGGKTLALGALMRDRGELHAFDVNRARLARLAPRLARSGLSIVRPQSLRDERDARLAPLAHTFDAVLVDAPCSASGTLRRNPELRLRIPDLAALSAQQRAILAAAARLVRPGGRLVYATCSVLREENEAVVDAFLAAHPAFRADGAPLVLLPHRDGTDGFYAARLTASAAPRPTPSGPRSG